MAGMFTPNSEKNKNPTLSKTTKKVISNKAVNVMYSAQEPNMVGLIKNNDLTIAPYSSKKGAKTKVLQSIQTLIDAQLTCSENAINNIVPTLFQRVHLFVSNMKKCVPNKYTGDVSPLKPMKRLKCNATDILSACMNVRLQTDIPHTEHDISYTVISTPKQKPTGKSNLMFHFIINQSKSFFLSMTILVTFTYSAKFVTHRQLHLSNCGNWINVSSYGNQRLFYNGRKSIQRINTCKPC